MSMLGKLLWVEFFKLLRTRRLYFVVALVVITTIVITAQYKVAFERERASFEEFREKATQHYHQTIKEYQENIRRLESEASLTLEEQSELSNTKEHLKKLQSEGPPVFKSISSPAQALYIVFLSDFGVHFILPIITALVVGANLAIERSNRTLKLLLLQPIRRTEVFLSKWGMAVLFVFGFLLVETLIGALIGSSVFGIEGWGTPASAIPGVMTLSTDMTTAEFVVWGTLYNALGMILIATIALTLSVYIASPIMILAGTLFASLFGMAASDFLHGYETFTVLWPFSHLNFTKHFYANPLFTVTESVVVLVAYIAVLLFVGMRSFRKKDLYV